MKASCFACRTPFARPDRPMLSRQAVAQILEECVLMDQGRRNTQPTRTLVDHLPELATGHRITAVFHTPAVSLLYVISTPL